MVFSTPIFLFLFLPATLILYFLVPRVAKNLLLVFFSLLFYAWGEGAYVLLMIGSILVNHLIGTQIIKNSDKKWLVTGVAFNIVLLIIFKYLNFVQEESGLTFWENIHLPIGVSFFTFQSISFLIDVYRKPSVNKLSLIKTATYISLFPQLIAGPIVRYHTIAAQLEKRKESILQVYYGASRFIIGLAKKVLIANQLGFVADQIFETSPAEFGPLTALLGVSCYTFQIYFDFSGYSDMAIGLGRIFGFKFPENFNLPYRASSIREFWRRWHITLSTWFRDYLYIPLGGSRKGNFRTWFNLLLVFVLCGFWHGPSWTFLIWGLWHGFFLGLERLKGGQKIPVLSNIYVMIIVMIGWVFFKSPDLNYALDYLNALFGVKSSVFDVSIASYYLNPEIVAVLTVAIALGFFKWKWFIGLQRKPALQGALLFVLLLLSCMYISGDTYNPFIYFQF